MPMFTISYSTQDLPGVEVRVTPLNAAALADRTGSAPIVCTVIGSHENTRCDGIWHPYHDPTKTPETMTIAYHRETLVEGRIVHTSTLEGAGGPDHAAVSEASLVELTGGPRTYPLCVAIWEHRALVARR